ncbi:MAG: TerC family protein [Verrucomicrobiales bacterium]
MHITPGLALFPFATYWWFYLVFIAFVIGVLVLDLGVFHRKAHEVKFKEAAVWSVIWISLAMVFAFGFWQFCRANLAHHDGLLAHFASMGIPESGWKEASLQVADQCALEFLTGYVIEQSLSVDNLFVFILIFGYFGIPRAYQHRVLFFGILGALVFRGIFIAIGAGLMQFHWVQWVFGAFLIYTGGKILFGGDNHPEPEKNPIIGLLKRWMPVTPELHGQKFIVHIHGIRHATPLLVCLACMEVTDIVFAVDSVPAIFAITSEPLIVFTSNLFAILGLRSLYFLLAELMNRFWALKYGLGLILSFVGLKMLLLNHLAGGKFPIGISLALILGTLALAVVVSLLFRKGTDEDLAGGDAQ